MMLIMIIDIVTTRKSLYVYWLFLIDFSLLLSFVFFSVNALLIIHHYCSLFCPHPSSSISHHHQQKQHICVVLLLLLKLCIHSLRCLLDDRTGPCPWDHLHHIKMCCLAKWSRHRHHHHNHHHQSAIIISNNSTFVFFSSFSLSFVFIPFVISSICQGYCCHLLLSRTIIVSSSLSSIMLLNLSYTTLSVLLLFHCVNSSVCGFCETTQKWEV